MISSSIILGLFLLTGNIWLALYVFHMKFLTYFTFFNLIIIQNTYFEEFFNKEKKFLILIMILFIILAIFYSLRKIAYG
ncbi:hypothetical protein LCGC14_0740930 [marine sediment metagenome]|uniref:Uncharacterized protein n=1 Tax=marine sediment metagenome TaxID=412755 RepID=A0A0F9Q6S6_9ZZZZ